MPRWKCSVKWKSSAFIWTTCRPLAEKIVDSARQDISAAYYYAPSLGFELSTLCDDNWKFFKYPHCEFYLKWPKTMTAKIRKNISVKLQQMISSYERSFENN